MTVTRLFSEQSKQLGMIQREEKCSHTCREDERDEKRERCTARKWSFKLGRRQVNAAALLGVTPSHPSISATTTSSQTPITLFSLSCLRLPREPRCTQSFDDAAYKDRGCLGIRPHDKSTNIRWFWETSGNIRNYMYPLQIELENIPCQGRSYPEVSTSQCWKGYESPVFWLNPSLPMDFHPNSPLSE